VSRTDLLERARRLRAARTPFVLATVVRARRPTSAKAGDSALVLPDGSLHGFVGGTCADATVRRQSLRLLATGESALLRITPEPVPDGEADESWDAGEGLVSVANPCLSGGALEIFLEAMLPPPLVRVFGEAPIARAVAEVGGALGYDVDATTDPAAPVPADAAAVVVASHGRDEEAVLAAALRAGVPYVGLVASPRRAAAVLAGLDADPAERARVRSPAGLDLGARTPAEVALSILAELIGSRTAAPPASGAPAPLPVAEAPPEDDVTVDPVCGMTVPADGTLRLEHGGRTYVFCGSGCRAAFADAPDRYLPA
jgi:xanthine dehydrogenase accessory factor